MPIPADFVPIPSDGEPVLPAGAHARARPWNRWPSSSPRIPGRVLGFLGLLALVFVAAFAAGRLSGPVAPDLREPGPPGAPVPMGADTGGGHGHKSMGAGMGTGNATSAITPGRISPDATSAGGAA
ncbi:hypothetical protein [Embleya sp. NBC_00896]|uniref:hypothetical protein n=1 Tax=Embleya sp. NBC_00896 TaxID=2975961 RepID=UPI002F91047A|nr:hypothetical protein OG928_39330 [Embleya sp. NBC_00896]